MNKQYSGHPSTVFKGRGAPGNPEGRFELYRKETVDDGWTPPQAPEAPVTQVSVDHSRRIITRNRSPDIPFAQSLNPYRGCEHGCSYCFARPTHSYLGLSPGLDFETRILYKPHAAEQLERELSKPGYRCEPIALGVNTDAYQPLERKLRVTRTILEVLAAHKHPVTLITKSALIERDLDLLAAMARENLVSAAVSVTSLDDDLGRRLEPRAAGSQRRLKVIERLSEAGVPTHVSVAPVIPVLNDGELERILEAAASRGARSADYVILRLPHEVRALFQNWLETHYPMKANHVMSRVREIHGGKEYDAAFGQRMRGQGEYAEMIAQRFRAARRKFGLDQPLPELDTSRFLPIAGTRGQMSLW